MRHTATTGNQFPVTAHVTVLILDNPPAPAHVQKKLLAAYGEILNHNRFVKALALNFHSCVFFGNFILFF